MTFWLDLSAPLSKLTDVDPVLRQQIADARKALKGDDPLHYRHMLGVSHHATSRVSRCFAGSAWLRRRFPARSCVLVYLLMTEEASVSVAHLETISCDDNSGPQEICCWLRIPTSWLAGPGDGLLGLRLFQAVLHALHAVGKHYGIGMPAASGPSADRGNSDVWDPFGPPPRPSYTDINAHLERLAASLHPEQLLVAVKEPASATVARKCRTVREALGTVVEQHTLTAPETKAAAWTIQTPS